MPVYEYACKACGHHLEVSQGFKDEPLTACPVCEGPLRKVFGSIGIILKGSGFYRTDSRLPAKKSEKAETADKSDKSEKPEKPAAEKPTAEKPAAEKSSSAEAKSSDSGGSTGSGRGTDGKAASPAKTA